LYEKKEIDISRRKFLQASIAGLTLAGLPDWFANEAIAAEYERPVARQKKFGPNDQINFGLIGAGGSRGGYRQGLGDARGAHGQRGCKVIAVCDVDALHLEEAAKVFGPETAKYPDYRELLARKDIDAVVIGTPDHWHSKVCVDALKAGKDVYCEKPLTLFIAEGRAIANEAKKRKRVFQVGSQQRSDGRFRLACELVRNGRIGNLKRVETHLPSSTPGGPFPETPPPDGFNWNMWLGPAPTTEYVKERTHGNFRWWREYSGGMMTDWGAHHNDIAQWALGMDEYGPIAIEGKGAKPEPSGKNCYNTYPTFLVTYTYPGNIPVNCMSEKENGVHFQGDAGWIFVSRGVIRASDQKLLDEPLSSGATKLYVSNNHMGNFVDCIRSREQTICTAEIGHRSVTVCHLGNLAMDLGRRLEWDPKKEKFKKDKEADKLLKKPMRAPWKV